MDAHAREELIHQIRDSFEEIETLVRGLDDDALMKRPGVGRWSVLEILCHLRDTERTCFRGRLRKLLTENRPFFPDWDHERAFEHGHYAAEDTRAVLATWRELRQGTLRALEEMPLEEWSKRGRHETQGSITFADVATHVRDHDMTHLGQILRNLADLRGPRGDSG
jgi:uncharacterized damage-inducible protein DinB